ncbi:UDP binding domain-containing protein [Kitasatospora sp. NPDC058444]|uniref:UDP binding domain-containing protein n=1 Tax=Kitasatospora sp. NPDC058444 TaxID=3346504 RepID=UPI00365C1EF4
MRVSVIGCGHLGIPHAAAMAELGHEVIGVDVDREKVARLNAGDCPIFEPGLPELLAEHIGGGRLRFTTDIAEAAAFAELHFIGVGTPIGAGGMRPGLGYGGGCLPKDVRAFTASARQLGATEAAGLLLAAEKINESRTRVAMDLVAEALGDRLLRGIRATVLGAAFKPDTSDVRESPALALAMALHRAGGVVTVHDPQASANALLRNPELDHTADLPAALTGAELVVLATEWPEYRQGDPGALVELPADPLLVDCRTTLDPDRWRSAGWRVHQLGRPGT